MISAPMAIRIFLRVGILLSLASEISGTSNSTLRRLQTFCNNYNISEMWCNCRVLADVCTPRPILVSDIVYLYAGFSAFAVILSVVGNTLVIGVAVNQGNNGSNFKRSVALLAFCDLMFATLQLIYMLPRFWTPYWVYGLMMCKVLNSAEIMGANLSVGMILIITVERYFGIVQPLKRGITKSMLI